MRDFYEQFHKKDKIKTDHASDKATSPENQFT